jgi:hypothetical protein
VTPPSSRWSPSDGNPSGLKTWSYYQNLKKSDPKIYNSARLQQEMHREAMKQGAAFFDK